MNATTPLEIDGVVFDRLHVNLSVASRTEEGEFRASVAARLVPYRVLEDGTDERRDDHARSVLVGDTLAAQSDPDFAAAIATITAAVQTWIIAKGF